MRIDTTMGKLIIIDICLWAILFVLLHYVSLHSEYHIKVTNMFIIWGFFVIVFAKQILQYLEKFC